MERPVASVTFHDKAVGSIREKRLRKSLPGRETVRAKALRCEHTPAAYEELHGSRLG